MPTIHESSLPENFQSFLREAIVCTETSLTQKPLQRPGASRTALEEKVLRETEVIAELVGSETATATNSPLTKLIERNPAMLAEKGYTHAIFLGGSFNPLHDGHGRIMIEEALQKLKEEQGIDRNKVAVILSPNSSAYVYSKLGGDFANGPQRLWMALCEANSMPNTFVTAANMTNLGGDLQGLVNTREAYEDWSATSETLRSLGIGTMFAVVGSDVARDNFGVVVSRSEFQNLGHEAIIIFRDQSKGQVGETAASSTIKRRLLKGENLDEMPLGRATKEFMAEHSTFVYRPQTHSAGASAAAGGGAAEMEGGAAASFAPDQTNYHFLVSEETRLKIGDYKRRLMHDGTAGALFGEKIAGRNLTSVSDEEFLELLVNTKKPYINAEETIAANGISTLTGQPYEWNKFESEILGDVVCAMPVTVFDNGVHRGENIRTHEPPFEGELIFVTGAILSTNDRLRVDPSIDDPKIDEPTPDMEEVLNGDGSINDEKLYKLYERRLLPAFAHANAISSQDEKAVITIPGMGCGKFAGNFSGQLESKIKDIVGRILLTHGHTLPNIAGVIYDPNNPASLDGQEVINGIEFRTHAGRNGAENSQLRTPEEQGFPGCKLFSIVAWDHYSWMTNDNNKGKRETDDGVKGSATNACSKMTGVRGEYNPATHQYQPPSPYKIWAEVIEGKLRNGTVISAPLQLQVQGNVTVVNPRTPLLPMSECEARDAARATMPLEVAAAVGGASAASQHSSDAAELAEFERQKQVLAKYINEFINLRVEAGIDPTWENGGIMQHTGLGLIECAIDSKNNRAISCDDYKVFQDSKDGQLKFFNKRTGKMITNLESQKVILHDFFNVVPDLKQKLTPPAPISLASVSASSAASQHSASASIFTEAAAMPGAASAQPSSPVQRGTVSISYLNGPQIALNFSEYDQETKERFGRWLQENEIPARQEENRISIQPSTNRGPGVYISANGEVSLNLGNNERREVFANIIGIDETNANLPATNKTGDNAIYFYPAVLAPEANGAKIVTILNRENLRSRRSSVDSTSSSDLEFVPPPAFIHQDPPASAPMAEEEMGGGAAAASPGIASGRAELDALWLGHQVDAAPIAGAQPAPPTPNPQRGRLLFGCIPLPRLGGRNNQGQGPQDQGGGGRV